MKGPNPFATPEGSTEGIAGRKEESRIFNGLLNSTGSSQSSMLIIKGGPGAGKSILMAAFKEEAERNGLLAPYAKAEKGEDMRALAKKLFQDASLLSGAASKESPADYPGLISSLGRMAGKRHFGAIAFIDDMDISRKADAQLAIILKTLGRNHVSFVISSTRDFRMEIPETVKLLELHDLNEHDALDMVNTALKKGPPKMGEECLNTMMIDTQGNPRLLKTVCRLVYDRLRDNERVISKGHYLAYLPFVMSMLGREWFGRMYQETPASERAIITALSSSDSGMHVSDVARMLRKPLGPTTALMKRLLDRGQVVRLDRGKYRVFARLYAKYVAQRA